MFVIYSLEEYKVYYRARTGNLHGTDSITIVTHTKQNVLDTAEITDSVVWVGFRLQFN